MKDQVLLKKHLVDLLNASNAHATFEQAIKKFPAELRGKTPEGAEHSAWELLEHLRIAQWDILEFIRDPKHKSPDFPSGYWPRVAEAPSASAWDNSVQGFRKDLNDLTYLVTDDATNLFAKIPHGDGQTILREVLLVADHNAYHVGQFILVRRLLGAWE
jgi:hypothetical protein